MTSVAQDGLCDARTRMSRKPAPAGLARERDADVWLRRVMREVIVQTPATRPDVKETLDLQHELACEPVVARAA